MATSTGRLPDVANRGGSSSQRGCAVGQERSRARAARLGRGAAGQGRLGSTGVLTALQPAQAFRKVSQREQALESWSPARLARTAWDARRRRRPPSRSPRLPGNAPVGPIRTPAVPWADALPWPATYRSCASCCLTGRAHSSPAPLGSPTPVPSFHSCSPSPKACSCTCHLQGSCQRRRSST